MRMTKSNCYMRPRKIMKSKMTIIVLSPLKSKNKINKSAPPPNLIIINNKLKRKKTTGVEVWERTVT